MINILKQQYKLLCSAREVELTFLNEFTDTQLNTSVKEFNDKTLLHFAIHINQVYIHWIGNFALSLNLNYIDESTITSFSQLGKLYSSSNELVTQFLNKYANDYHIEIKKEFSGKKITTSPLQLFTHVITHEFHHKGQMMTMVRLLGKTPPDTDIIRT